jgi:hypothetical protein
MKCVVGGAGNILLRCGINFFVPLVTCKTGNTQNRRYNQQAVKNNEVAIHQVEFYHIGQFEK